MNDLITREDALLECEALIPIDCKMMKERINGIPSAEPNLILPERMERGECYEVGETIVFMNHDDYYDLLCRAMENEPKQGEWIPCSEGLPEDIRPVLVTWKNNDPASYYQYIVGKHFIGTAHYCKGKWHWYSSVTEDLLAEYGKCESEEFDEAIEAVAWMPLPLVYEGDRYGKG